MNILVHDFLLNLSFFSAVGLLDVSGQNSLRENTLQENIYLRARKIFNETTKKIKCEGEKSIDIITLN